MSLKSRGHHSIFTAKILRSKHLASLVLMATLFITLFPSSTVIYAQQQQTSDPQTGTTQQLTEMALRAQNRVHALRTFIEERLGDIPADIDALIDEGDIVLAEAEGDVSQLLEAMKTYRKAYRSLHQLLEQHDIDLETPEQARRLLVAISRVTERLHSLAQITVRLRDTYRIQIDSQAQQFLGWVEGNLTEAQTHLDQAKAALIQSQNITGAALNFTEATGHIRQAQTALQLIARWTYRWRIRNFLEDLVNLKEQIREQIRVRMQQGGFNVTDILTELGYEDLEDFYQTIDQLMADAVENAEDLREAVQNLWTIRVKLGEMAFRLQNS